ncbi:hypothetical protein NAPIS_ORF02188 [Vairimorpha apis BRL 01]|uniref:Uncharacterized protein n=1 Tax=Vairimorpha apis BRL 01 TaxID=1037528 RepID=T0L6C7_9MICR|nr:hypothetical protein NAPIS_ORF02188 [Vairimorpha apis BRL 01]
MFIPETGILTVLYKYEHILDFVVYIKKSNLVVNKNVFNKIERYFNEVVVNIKVCEWLDFKKVVMLCGSYYNCSNGVEKSNVVEKNCVVERYSESVNESKDDWDIGSVDEKKYDNGLVDIYGSVDKKYVNVDIGSVNDKINTKYNDNKINTKYNDNNIKETYFDNNINIDKLKMESYNIPIQEKYKIMEEYLKKGLYKINWEIQVIEEDLMNGDNKELNRSEKIELSKSDLNGKTKLSGSEKIELNRSEKIELSKSDLNGKTKLSRNNLNGKYELNTIDKSKLNKIKISKNILSLFKRCTDLNTPSFVILKDKSVYFVPQKFRDGEILFHVIGNGMGCNSNDNEMECNSNDNRIDYSCIGVDCNKYNRIDYSDNKIYFNNYNIYNKYNINNNYKYNTTIIINTNNKRLINKTLLKLNLNKFIIVTDKIITNVPIELTDEVCRSYIPDIGWNYNLRDGEDINGVYSLCEGVPDEFYSGMVV